MTGILIRRGENIQRHKRQRSGEDGGRDGSELTIRQKKKCKRLLGAIRN